MCYHQYLDTLDIGHSTPPDVTMQKMCLCLSITLQMAHDQRDALKNYWCTLNSFLWPCYRNMMKRDRFCRIVRRPHFSNNENEGEKTHSNDEQLWKMRTMVICDKFCAATATY
jgi:hypothetical protein